jgi:hypothetical protein
MRSANLFAALAGLAVFTLAIAVPAASAESTFCKATETPCSKENTYGAGTTLKATQEGNFKLAKWEAFSGLTCQQGSLAGELETSTSPKGPLTSLALEKCSATTKVLKAGSFSVRPAVEHDATIEMTGLELEVISGTTCIFGGSVSSGITLLGGPVPYIEVDATLNKIGGSGTCPSSTTWTATYAISSPTPLHLTPLSEPPVLCGVEETSCARPLTAGTVLWGPLEPKSEFALTPSGSYLGASCSAASAEATLSHAAPPRASNTELTVSECTHEVTVLGSGEMTIDWTSEYDGTVTWNDLLISSSSGVTCIFGGDISSGIQLHGGSTATLEVSTALPKVLGSGSCPSSVTWHATFELNEPEPLYVSETGPTRPPETLCESTEASCSAPIEQGAELLANKEVSQATFTVGEKTTTCGQASLAGEVRTLGVIRVRLSSLGGEKCEGPQVNFLRSGYLTLAFEGEHNALAKSATGIEFEIQKYLLGVNCTYAGSVNGGFTLTGGNPAKLDVTATLPTNSPGICPSSAVWHGEYTLKSEPLYVSES